MAFLNALTLCVSSVMERLNAVLYTYIRRLNTGMCPPGTVLSKEKKMCHIIDTVEKTMVCSGLCKVSKCDKPKSETLVLLCNNQWFPHAAVHCC